MITNAGRTTRPSVTLAQAPQTIGQRRATQIAAARRPDAILLIVVLALVTLGLVMVLSASEFADPLDPTYYARREALWAGLGGLALAVAAHVDYQQWRRLATPGIILAGALTAAVLRLGVSAGGAQRWLGVGGFLTFQPSEVAKLAFVLFAADRLAHGRDATRAAVLVAGAGAALTGLVLLQNDLGTALVLGTCALALLVAGGAPWRLLLPGGLGALALGAVVIAATPFRRARITAFLHPLRCDLASSYQVCQSLLALGSGGPLGRGLGQSIQKAGYLPAPFTDSIYAVIGEELGFWGALLVIALVGALLWRGLAATRRAPDRFGALLALGVTVWIVTQAALNIGSSVAALPFTGVPLPFVSFGGSSLIVLLAAVGVVLNVSAQGAAQAARWRA